MAKRFFIENITENKQGISPSLSLRLSSYSKKEGTYFLVELPAYIWVGNLFSATITAKNADGTTDKQYKGDCTITENGAGSISPSEIVSTEWENGVTTKALIYSTDDIDETTLIITVTDDIKPWIMGSGKTRITYLPHTGAKIVFNNELYCDSARAGDREYIYVVTKDWVVRKKIPKGSSDPIGKFINYFGVLYYSIGQYNAGETGIGNKSALYKIINDEPVLAMAEVDGALARSLVKKGNYMWMGKLVGSAPPRFHILKYRPGEENWIDTDRDGYLRGSFRWISHGESIFIPFCENDKDNTTVWKIDEDGTISLDYTGIYGYARKITSIYVFEDNLYFTWAESYYGEIGTQKIYKRIGTNNWELQITITDWILGFPVIIYKNKLWTLRTQGEEYSDHSLFYTEDGVNFIYYMDREIILSTSPSIIKGIMAADDDAIDFNDSFVGNITTRNYTEEIIMQTIGPIIEGEP